MSGGTDNLKVQRANNVAPLGPNGKFIAGNPNWTKGVSGNPNGRPKCEPLLTPELRRQLNQVCPDDPKGRIWLVVIAEKTMKLAAKGNPAAIKEIWERIDGKVKDNIQLDVRISAIRQMSDAELEKFIADATVQAVAERASA